MSLANEPASRADGDVLDVFSIRRLPSTVVGAVNRLAGNLLSFCSYPNQGDCIDQLRGVRSIREVWGLKFDPLACYPVVRFLL